MNSPNNNDNLEDSSHAAFSRPEHNEQAALDAADPAVQQEYADLQLVDALLTSMSQHTDTEQDAASAE